MNRLDGVGNLNELSDNGSNRLEYKTKFSAEKKNNKQTELGGGWHKTTTAEHSWSYTSDQNSPTVCFNGHSVTMYSRGFV